MGRCTFGAIFGERVRGFGVAALIPTKSRKGSDFWTCPPKGSDFCMSSQKLAEGSHFWSTGDIMPKIKNLAELFYHKSSLKFNVKMHFFGRSWVGALLVQFSVKGFEVLAWLRTFCPNLGRVRTFGRALQRVRTFACLRKNLQRVRTFETLATSC